MAKTHLVPTERACAGRLILRAACGRLVTGGVATRTALDLVTCAQCANVVRARRLRGNCPDCLMGGASMVQLDVHGDCPVCEYHSNAAGLWFRGFHYA